MVSVWSFRLGSYLFYRIHIMGKDDRFDKMRDSLSKITRFWILQAMTIWFLMFPVTYFMSFKSSVNDLNTL